MKKTGKLPREIGYLENTELIRAALERRVSPNDIFCLQPG